MTAAGAAQHAMLVSQLRQAVAASRADGTYDGDQVDRIIDFLGDLARFTPLPRIADAPARLNGVWITLFAQFGARHTAGKPVRHTTTMNLLSFNKLPPAPIELHRIEQEVEAAHGIYDNVHLVTPPDGGMEARLTVHGRFTLDPAEPLRLQVAFGRVSLRGTSGESDDEVRRAFALDQDDPLVVEFKPPTLHTDVAYCDDTLRINFGSLGGAYLVERLPGRSIAALG